MSATAAAANSVLPGVPAPARPSGPSPRGADTDDRFDRQLDAAREQQRQPAQPDADHTHAAPAPSPVPSKASSEQPETQAKTDDEADQGDAQDPAAGTLAAAMLALIGQAAPAAPAISGATHALGALAGVARAATAGVAAALSSGDDGVGEDTTGATDTGAQSAGSAASMLAVSLVPTPGTDATVAPSLMPVAATQRKEDPLSALQAANAQASTLLPSTVSAPAPAHTLSIASPVGTPTFAQELGQQVAWLGGQEIKQARIRLHPEDLGSMDVKVSIAHDRVDVAFAVQHPAAVHALQQTLPQLDTLLAHHGLALGQADVGQRQQQGEGGRAGEAAGAGEIEAEPGLAASTMPPALGMLDTFA